MKLTPEWFRAQFPDAKLVCECPSMNDVCPASCERLKGWRGEFRDWLAAADVEAPDAV